MYLRREHGERNQSAEEADGYPVGHTLAQAKVHDNELELAEEGQLALHDVVGSLAPKLHWAACPAVLLLTECEEACW